MAKNNYSAMDLSDLRQALDTVVDAGELDQISVEIQNREKAARLADNRVKQQQCQQEAQRRMTLQVELDECLAQIAGMTEESNGFDATLYRVIETFYKIVQSNNKLLSDIYATWRKACDLSRKLGIEKPPRGKKCIFNSTGSPTGKDEWEDAVYYLKLYACHADRLASLEQRGFTNLPVLDEKTFLHGEQSNPLDWEK